MKCRRKQICQQSDVPFKIFSTGKASDLILSFQLTLKLKNKKRLLCPSLPSSWFQNDYPVFLALSEQKSEQLSNLNFVAVLGFLVSETFEFREYCLGREAFYKQGKSLDIISYVFYALKSSLEDYVRT